MTSSSKSPRSKTPPAADQAPDESPGVPETERDARRDANGADDGGLLEEVREVPEELGGAAAAVRADIEGTWIAKRAVDAYFWVLARAPATTRGRLILAFVIGVVALAPSFGLMYVSLTAGQDSTEAWFGKLGYAGVFLANFAGTATLFIPVPGLTAAAQALIASSSNTLSPFWLGIFGGVGMAVGEITAYVAGMATALIAQQEDFKAPKRFEGIVNRVVRSVNWLMARYGMPTLFLLSAVPNVFFEVAGLTAGATRYTFWKFMASVTAGKIVRAMLLAYVGEKIFFG